MSLGFLGEFQHSLDAKGRVILPVEYREPLGGGAVLTRVLDGCLAVYSEGEFELLAERVRESARQSARQRQMCIRDSPDRAPIDPRSDRLRSPCVSGSPYDTT